MGSLPIPHPTCAECGPVRDFGLGRPLKGIEVRAAVDHVCLQLRESIDFTDTERRMVLGKLKRLDVPNPYAHSRAGQIALLVETISKVVDVDPGTVFSHLEMVNATSILAT